MSLEIQFNKFCEKNPLFQSCIVSLPDLSEKNIEIQPIILKKFKATQEIENLNSSTTLPKDPRKILLSKGINLKEKEIKKIQKCISDPEDFIQDLITIGSTSFIVTRVEENYFALKNVDLVINGGLVIFKAPRFLILVQYPNSIQLPKVIFVVDKFSKQL